MPTYAASQDFFSNSKIFHSKDVRRGASNFKKLVSGV